MGFLENRFRAIERLFRRDIWQPSVLNDRSWRGRSHAFLRVIAITVTGLFENHISIRAAALSYASLLGLGPLVVIGVLVAGLMLNQHDPSVAVNALNRVIKHIAPQVEQFERLENKPGAAGAPAAQASPHGPAAVAAVRAQPPNPALVQLINSFIVGSRSGTAGAIGALTLVLIVIQLFTTIENAFNAVWGVRRGRSWLVRVVFYWTIATLGAVLFFASLTALSAAAFLNVFFERLPFGVELLRALKWLLPLFSAGILLGVLTVFYRYIPNTRVDWRSALAGALFVTALVFLNNYLAFLYFKRVMLQNSLYGSLGILPVLMLGLYIFWFFMLVGGQLSYAVQNANFRSSQAAWHNLSESTRESLSLLVLLIICRRFRQCGPAHTVSELGALIRVPSQILNECLNRLVDLGLVTPIPPAPGQPSLDYRYQPARPLSRISLFEFKRLFENYGENPMGDGIDLMDPVLRRYHEHLAGHWEQGLGDRTLEDLLADFPAETAAS